MKKLLAILVVACLAEFLAAQEKKAQPATAPAAVAPPNAAPMVKPELARQLLEVQVKYFRAVAEQREIEARYPLVRKEVTDAFQQLAALKALAEKEAGEGFELDLQELKLVPKPAPAQSGQPGKAPTAAKKE